MKSIRNLIGAELKWYQPHILSRQYELQVSGELAATLCFRSSFGSLATAESADGCWSFKRTGFWQTRVTIRRCDVDEDIAVFRNNTWTGGGTLELPDGRTFRANTNFWMTEFEFTTDAGESLVKYRRIGGILHCSSMVHIEPAAASLDELPWLVALGWYLTLMMHADSAAAG